MIATFSLIASLMGISPSNVVVDTEVSFSYNCEYENIKKASFNSKKKIKLDQKFDLILSYTNYAKIVNVSIETSNKILGLTCPQAIFIRSENSKIITTLSRYDIEKFKNDWILIKDPAARSTAWNNLWNSVQRGQVSARTYVEIILANLPYESNVKILTLVLLQMQTLNTYLLKINEENSIILSKAMAELCARMAMTKEDSTLQNIWFYNYVVIARQDTQLDHLYQIIKANASIEGLKITDELRWLIIIGLNRFNYPNSINLIKEEMKNNPNSNFAAMADAIRPSQSNKVAWLRKIQGRSEDKALLTEVMRILYPPEQVELALLTQQYRLESLEKQVKINSISNIDDFIPHICNYKASKHIFNQQRVTKEVKNLLINALIEEYNCNYVLDAIRINLEAK